MLHAEIPLADARRMEMRRQKNLRVGERERDILARRGERERTAARDAAPWVTELIGAAGKCDLRTVGRVLSHHSVRNEGPYRIIQKRPARPDRRSSTAGRIVDHSE